MSQNQESTKLQSQATNLHLNQNSHQGQENVDLTITKKDQKTFKKVIQNLSPYTRTQNGRFNPDLLMVGPSYLYGEEFLSFIADDNPVIYGFTQEERKKGTLNFDPTKHYLLDSNNQRAECVDKIYNLTKDKELIVELPEMHHMTLNHSSIGKDAAVICAGYITIQDGKITLLDNKSGHYQPSDLNLYRTIQILSNNDQSPFAENCIVLSYASGPKELKQFLTYMEEKVEVGKNKIPRYQKMQQDVVNDAKKMAAKHDKLYVIKPSKAAKENSMTLAQLVSSMPKLEIEDGKSYRLQFPKEVFSSDYVEKYKQKVGAHYEVNTLTLTSKDLCEYLYSEDSQSIPKVLLSLAKAGLNNDSHVINLMVEKGDIKELGDYCFNENMDNTLAKMHSYYLTPTLVEKYKNILPHLISNMSNPVFMKYLPVMVDNGMVEEAQLKKILENNIDTILSNNEVYNVLVNNPPIANEIGKMVCNKPELYEQWKKSLPNMILGLSKFNNNSKQSLSEQIVQEVIQGNSIKKEGLESILSSSYNSKVTREALINNIGKLVKYMSDNQILTLPYYIATKDDVHKVGQSLSAELPHTDSGEKTMSALYQVLNMAPADLLGVETIKKMLEWEATNIDTVSSTYKDISRKHHDNILSYLFDNIQPHLPSYSSNISSVLAQADKITGTVQHCDKSIPYLKNTQNYSALMTGIGNDPQMHESLVKLAARHMVPFSVFSTNDQFNKLQSLYELECIAHSARNAYKIGGTIALNQNRTQVDKSMHSEKSETTRSR